MLNKGKMAKICLSVRPNVPLIGGSDHLLVKTLDVSRHCCVFEDVIFSSENAKLQLDFGCPSTQERHLKWLKTEK